MSKCSTVRGMRPCSTGGAGAEIGLGDWVLVAGEARRRAQLAPGTRYLPLDKGGAPTTHWIWDRNPDIAKPGETHDGTIGYVNGLRAYIERAIPKKQYIFRAYEPHPATIVLPERAIPMARQAAGAVVFNPTIKFKAPPNKDWGVENWTQLIAENRGVRWIQVGESGPTIRGAERAQTADFWDALGLLSGARAVVCHEGALHHAAAGLGVPAVVVRGGFISPRVTGYAGQVDLYVEDERYPLGCGMRVRCPHCSSAMASIKPWDVMQALRSALPKAVAA